jgi:hypothetical protein
MPSDTYILTISEAGVSVPSNHASTHITGGADQIPDATSTTSGLMSATMYNEHVANNAKVSNIQHTGDVTDANGVLTVNKIKGVDISSFANNSVLKVTTGGIIAPAVAADYPTLNQSTTGNALTATSAGKATNLAGGSTGTLPYQTANDTTTMLPVGTSGTVLKSNGAAAPSWSTVEKSMLSTALSAEITANTAKISNKTHTGDVVDTDGALKVTGINNTSLIGLGSGLLKINSSGIPSIATSSDLPPLTGNAATATYATTAGSAVEADSADTATYATSAGSATTSGKATNLAGGSAGTLPYQTASDTTAMLSSGTAGTVLKSNGVSAPSWSAIEKSMLSTALSNEITANTAKVSNKTHTGDVVDVDGALKVTALNNVNLAGLGAGILKLDGSGRPSIVTQMEYPTLNQDTTGNAATATTAVSSSKATNLAGGSTGTLPYQSSNDTTAMLPVGSSGTVLKSNGAAAPSWSAIEKSMLSGTLANEITANTAKVSNKTHTGDVNDVDGVLTVTKINNVALVGLGDGLLKNNSSTGTPSIASASDFPTLNQNTTGNAATATTAVSAGTATNLAGGGSGSVPYQSNANTTQMVSAGASGTVLKSNGTSAPSWSAVEKSMLSETLSAEITANTAKVSNKTHTGDVNDVDGVLTVTKINNVALVGLGEGILKNNNSNGRPSIATASDFPTLNQNTTGNAATATLAASATKSTNLAGGVAGSIPYQTSTDQTVLLSPNSSGYLKTNGSGAPSWSNISASDISGTIPVANGGTGADSLTGYVKGSGTNAMTASSTIPASDIDGVISVDKGGTGAITLNGYVKGSGTSNLTASSTIPVADISGTIPVNKGGTGATSLTGYVKGSGTNDFTAAATVPVDDISGILSVGKGGTGAISLTGYVKGNGTGDMTAQPTIPATDITGLPAALEVPDAGFVVSNGATLESVDDISLVSDVTGVLDVPNGGTGMAAPNGYLFGNGLGSVVAVDKIPAADIDGLSGGLIAPAAGIVTSDGTDLGSVEVLLPANGGFGVDPSNTSTGSIFYSTFGENYMTPVSPSGTGGLNQVLLTTDGSIPSYGKVKLDGSEPHVSGILPVSRGGTGSSSPSGYFKGDGAGGGAFSAKIPVADIDGVISGGSTNLADATGILTINKGGTGSSSPSGYFKGNGAGGGAFLSAIPAGDIVGLTTGTPLSSIDLSSALGTLPGTKGGTGYNQVSHGTMRYSFGGPLSQLGDTNLVTIAAPGNSQNAFANGLNGTTSVISGLMLSNFAVDANATTRRLSYKGTSQRRFALNGYIQIRAVTSASRITFSLGVENNGSFYNLASSAVSIATVAGTDYDINLNGVVELVTDGAIILSALLGGSTTNHSFRTLQGFITAHPLT